MYEILNFVSLIKPEKDKNQNKCNNTVNAKYKILVKELITDEFFVATAISNREVKRAAKKLRPNGLVRIILGQGEAGEFLKNTPVIHVSNLEVINFYKTDKV